MGTAMHQALAAALTSAGAAHHAHVMASSSTQATQRSLANKGSGKGGPAASQLRPTRLLSACSAPASILCHAAASWSNTLLPQVRTCRACSHASDAASCVLTKNKNGSSSPSIAAKKLSAPSHCAAAMAACWLPPPPPSVPVSERCTALPALPTKGWRGGKKAHVWGNNQHPGSLPCQSTRMPATQAAFQAELCRPLAR